MVSERRTGAARGGRLRVGIIGLGAVAQAVYLPLIDRLVDHFVLAAVCDLSPSLVDALGSRYRVPAGGRFVDADALIASAAIDAVIVLSSGSHGAVAAAAMRRGLPVLCEKPLALTLAEADELASIASTSGSTLQLGYMKLYDPAVAAARRWLDDRGPGRSTPRSIEVTVLHPPSEPQLAHARLLPAPTDVPAPALDALRGAADLLATTALGDAPAELKRLYSGILLGSIVHELALIRHFAGDPTDIDDVDAWPLDSWPPSVAIGGRLRDESRFSIRWHYLRGFPAYREEVRLVFDDATVELLFPSPYLMHAPTRLTITDGDEAAFRDTDRGSYVEAFEQQLLAFHAFVVDGQPPLAGIAEGRADIVTCQAMARRRAERLGVPIGGEAAAAG